MPVILGRVYNLRDENNGNRFLCNSTELVTARGLSKMHEHDPDEYWNILSVVAKHVENGYTVIGVTVDKNGEYVYHIQKEINHHDS